MLSVEFVVTLLASRTRDTTKDLFKTSKQSIESKGRVRKKEGKHQKIEAKAKGWYCQLLLGFVVLYIILDSVHQYGMGTVATKSGRNKMEQNEIGYRRRAAHAGSWYTNKGHHLKEQLSSMMQAAVDSTTQRRLKAVICPHAGFSYSGATAAFSYQNVQEELEQNPSITTILVLHPSHHVYLDGCAISGATELETPLGNLTVDTSLREELLSTGNFSVMNQEVDENEHSGEMQYPFLALAAQNANALDRVQVLPVMVGSITNKSEAFFGKIFAPIIARPHVLCVISSDFMHWGSRFGYQPTLTCKPIHEHISDLDHQGMDLIQGQQPEAFAKYLKETKNTICGRHPISVWLQAVQVNSSSDKEKLDITFIKYDRSSLVMTLKDSSVSYASAVALKAS